MVRIAAIDIGTVTCRLLVADVDIQQRDAGVAGSATTPALSLTKVAKEYEITNLGEDVDKTGVLRADAIGRVYAALERFIARMRDVESDGTPVSAVRVMATSASRDAKNANEFVEALAKLNLTPEIISGAHEAALSFLGATYQRAGQPCAVADIGGGSTEISIGPGAGTPGYSRSFNMGCRRVTERFFAADPPAEDEIAAAREWIAGNLGAVSDALTKIGSTQGAPAASPALIAVAGTATSVVSVREKMQVYDSSRVHGAHVTRKDLEQVTGMLARLPLEQRRQVVGLDPGRAPVIAAGLVILEEVMKAFDADFYVASESDILDGMIIDAARAMSTKQQA